MYLLVINKDGYQNSKLHMFRKMWQFNEPIICPSPPLTCIYVWNHDKLHRLISNPDMWIINLCKLINIKFKFSWRYHSSSVWRYAEVIHSRFLKSSSCVQSSNSSYSKAPTIHIAHSTEKMLQRQTNSFPRKCVWMFCPACTVQSGRIKKKRSDIRLVHVLSWGTRAVSNISE